LFAPSLLLRFAFALLFLLRSFASASSLLLRSSFRSLRRSRSEGEADAEKRSGKAEKQKSGERSKRAKKLLSEGSKAEMNDEAKNAKQRIALYLQSIIF
jgi:hypothetical protein